MVSRLLIAGAIVLGAALAFPGSAQADPLCSSRKTIPNVSIYYNFCDDEGLRTWGDLSTMQNDHGADITIDTQMYIRLDGDPTPTWLPIRSYYLHTGRSYLDPYKGTTTLPGNTVIIGYTGGNSCTPGHRYFPVVRMRLHSGGAWGLPAGAGEFVCPG